jgi:hypothetical protein
MRTDLVRVPQTIEYRELATLLTDPKKRLKSYPLVDNTATNYLVGAVYALALKTLNVLGRNESQ